MSDDVGRLHPDGAPGLADAQGRQQYGDLRWERFLEAEKSQQGVNFLTGSANIDILKQNAAYASAKAKFWDRLGNAVSLFGVGTFGLLVAEIVRAVR